MSLICGYTYSVVLDKWELKDQAVDYVYIGQNKLDFEVPGTLGVICDWENWENNYQSKQGYYPYLQIQDLSKISSNQIGFLLINAENPIDYTFLHSYPNIVIVLRSEFTNTTQLFREVRFNFAKNNLLNPVILQFTSLTNDRESFQIMVSTKAGALLVDGFGDGIWLKSNQAPTIINSTSFGILQATRTRISKTEYISCPSCGRTLFDLQEITAKIRKETSHLKGLKIGIMGCIVNGPGEMADADYGYVGTRLGKITLYKERNVMRKNVPAEDAVSELISLIKEYGDWIETPVV